MTDFDGPDTAPFNVPCYAPAGRLCDDPGEQAAAVARVRGCVLLYRDAATIDAVGRQLGFPVVLVIATPAALVSVLDAARRAGCDRACVDLVRTPDGQFACHYHPLDALLATTRAVAAALAG